MDSVRKLVEGFLTSRNKKEYFGDDTFIQNLSIIIALIIIVLLQLFVGKYLWNNYLTRLIPSIQPAEGMIDILAISLLFRLLCN